MFGILCPSLLCALALVTAAVPALAAGEDILAASGRYTFFIKPDPASCVTFHQKMVPCIERKTVGVPRTVVETYPLPVPSRQKQRVLVTETPVGDACGVTPCINCFPKPVCKPGTTDVIVPSIVPIRIPTLVIQPKCVERRIKLPQWFAVEEQPLPPPQKVRKIHSPG